MRFIIFILLTICFLTASGQKVKELKPVLGYLIDKNPEKEPGFLADMEKCSAIWEKLNAGTDTASLPQEQKVLLPLCIELEMKEGYWDILEQGCSWYCGGGGYEATASSGLGQQNENTYNAKNAYDLSYKTAWVEGAAGYGIGEYLLYRFPPQNPRVTKVIVVNGYVKSEQLWKENSRVKKLKMYINNKPYAILHLADSRQEQTFSFSPIGNSNRDNWEKLMKLPWWTMKFEIMEVYKGEKYADTAITEIYFDGIDHH